MTRVSHSSWLGVESPAGGSTIHRVGDPKRGDDDLAEMTGGKGRALFVSYDGLLEPLGSSQILPYVLGLAQKGYALAVLSFEKPDDLLDEARVGRLSDRLRNAGVRWIQCRYHRNPSLPATAWDVSVGARAIRSFAPDLVHARSYVPGAMALLARRSTSFRLLFDMRGFWIDERVESGAWRVGQHRVRMARRVERGLLRQADHIVHLTQSAATSVSRLTSGGGISALSVPPHDVISTSVPLDRFQVPQDAARVRQELGLESDGPVLIHSGTMGHRYRSAWTMAVARDFKRQGGGLFIVLSKELDELSALASSEGVDALVRSLDHEHVPRYLQAADAGMAFMRTGFATKASAPTKIGEYLACGLAVGASPVGDLRAQFTEAESSFVVEQEDSAEEVARRLLMAAREPGRGVESRALAVRHYSQEDALDSYSDIYMRMGLVPCV